MDLALARKRCLRSAQPALDTQAAQGRGAGSPLSQYNRVRVLVDGSGVGGFAEGLGTQIGLPKQVCPWQGHRWCRVWGFRV